jgi:hypothetical protein
LGRRLGNLDDVGFFVLSSNALDHDLLEAAEVSYAVTFRLCNAPNPRHMGTLAYCCSAGLLELAIAAQEAY